MREVVVSLDSMPIEQTKVFYKSLCEAELPESFYWFDKLECRTSPHRAKDDETTLEKYLAHMGQASMVFFAIDRKEWHPETGDSMQTISFMCRNVHMRKWRFPAKFEDIVREKYPKQEFDWIFYPNERVAVEVPEIKRKWNRLSRYRKRMQKALPDTYSEDLPEVIRQCLPEELRDFIIFDTERNIERFAFYFCEFTKPNFREVNKLYKQAYGLRP